MVLKLIEETGVSLKFGTDVGRGEDDYHDNTFEVWMTREGGLRLELNEPWYGSTDEGFGRSQDMTISREQAVYLLGWLQRTLTK